MPKADVFLIGSRGMDSNADPRLLPTSQYAKGINLSLTGGKVSTRLRVIVHPITGLLNQDDLGTLNVQGACFYNPSRGQSFQGFGRDFSSIALAAAGRTFMLSPKQGASQGFNASEITTQVLRDPDWHLCQLLQAENYLIACQQPNNTWIYDGTNPPFESPGINVTDKEKSRLPNACSTGLYAHGRIHMVQNGRQVLVGDIIHKLNQTNAANILGTTEQVYWATGAWFSPPSDWDELVCMFVLPLQNTTHGHGEPMAGGPSGIMSLNTIVYPRSSWINTEMVKHVAIGAGPMGPYSALPIVDGDVFFRSRFGIQTLRSAATQGRALGGPMRQVGEEVNCWLDRDAQSLLRYSSLGKMERLRKIKATTSPWVNGRRWGHRGIVSLHLLPNGTRDLRPAWEGMDTFPDEVKYPVMLVNADFERVQRTFAFCYGTDGILRLAELTGESGDDLLSDGTRERIPAVLVTPQFTAGVPAIDKTFDSATLLFGEVTGRLDYTLACRTSKNPDWRKMGDGRIEVTENCCSRPFERYLPGVGDNTFQFPSEYSSGSWVQFRVSWLGQASLTGVRIDYNDNEPNRDRLNINQCLTFPQTTDDRDFAHSLT